MRVAYLDEAGISNQKHEPTVVMAGVIVHGDRHWKAISLSLQEIAARHVPNPEQRRRLTFHAAELYSGGQFFNRDNWPLEKRLAILEDIVKLIPEHGVQVIAGWRRRDDTPNYYAYSQTEIAYLSGYIECIHSIEQWMNQNAPGEVCAVIAEDGPGIKGKFRRMHDRMLRGGMMYKERYLLPPITKVIDTVHFVEKQQSSLLQLADACAFVIKRNQMNDQHVARFMRYLEPFRPVFSEP